MDVNIRRCMVSDARNIYELCVNELGYDFTYEQVEANVRRLLGSKENLILVAADVNDNCIGFIHANNHDPIYAPPMKDVIAVAVTPEKRNKGIGGMLIRAVEKWARDTGAAGVRLNAGVEQNVGVFYKAQGYTYMKTAYNYRKMF